MGGVLSVIMSLAIFWMCRSGLFLNLEIFALSSMKCLLFLRVASIGARGLNHFSAHRGLFIALEVKFLVALTLLSSSERTFWPASLKPRPGPPPKHSLRTYLCIFSRHSDWLRFSIGWKVTELASRMGRKKMQ